MKIRLLLLDGPSCAIDAKTSNAPNCHHPGPISDSSRDVAVKQTRCRAIGKFNDPSWVNQHVEQETKSDQPTRRTPCKKKQSDGAGGAHDRGPLDAVRGPRRAPDDAPDCWVETSRPFPISTTSATLVGIRRQFNLAGLPRRGFSRHATGI